MDNPRGHRCPDVLYDIHVNCMLDERDASLHGVHTGLHSILGFVFEETISVQSIGDLGSAEMTFMQAGVIRSII